MRRLQGKRGFVDLSRYLMGAGDTMLGILLVCFLLFAPCVVPDASAAEGDDEKEIAIHALTLLDAKVFRLKSSEIPELRGRIPYFFSRITSEAEEFELDDMSGDRDFTIVIQGASNSSSDELTVVIEQGNSARVIKLKRDGFAKEGINSIQNELVLFKRPVHSEGSVFLGRMETTRQVDESLDKGLGIEFKEGAKMNAPP